MGLESYSLTAGSNTKTPPNGAPEGMSPGLLNDCIRQVMADTRAWYENPQWVNPGTSYNGATLGNPAYFSPTQFTVAGDVSGLYTVNRRVKAFGTTPFTIFGTVTAVAYSSPTTTVTVAWDSGSLDSTLTTVWFGAISPTNSSLSSKTIGAANLNGFGAPVTIASAATTDLGTAGTNNVVVSGSTAITSLGSTAAASSPVYVVMFSGVLTLTYNATSLILPGAANITTAAGDAMVAEYLGSGNWRVLSYYPASGKALVQQTIGSASTTQQGIVQLATASVVAAGTDNTQAVTPLGLPSCPGVAKAWAVINGTTGALIKGYNIGSVSRTSTGVYSITFATAFADANYLIQVSNRNPSGSANNSVISDATAPTTSTAVIQSRNTNSGGLTDSVTMYASFFSL